MIINLFFFVLLILCVFGDLICEYPEVPVVLTKQYSTQTEVEYIFLYHGNISENNLVQKVNNYFMDYQNITYSFCLSQTIYTLVLTSSSISGWQPKSRIYLSVNSINIFEYSLFYKMEYTFTFKPYFPLNRLSIWKYSLQTGTYSTSWNLESFDDSSWNTYTQSNFPNTTSHTRYYRFYQPILDMTSIYTLFQIGIYTKEGVAIYINGKELIRYNLPSTTLSQMTYALEEDPEYTMKSITNSMTYFMQNQTYLLIAVEIHPIINLKPSIDSFYAYFYPILGTSLKRSIFGTSKGVSLVPYDSNISNLFDDNPTTEWSCMLFGACMLTYRYPSGHREWINALQIRGTVDLDTNVKSFSCSGSNDGGISWTLISTFSHVLFSEAYEVRTFTFMNHFESYNMYKIDVTSANTGILMSVNEIILLTMYTPLKDYPLYPTSTLTNYLIIDKSLYIVPSLINYNSFAFKDVAVLPEGVNIDMDTGEIYGIPHSSFTGQITFSAVNKQSKILASSSFFFTFQMCSNKTNIPLYMHKVSNGDSAFNEYVSLVMDSDVQLFSFGGILNQTQDYTLCLLPKTYTLYLSSLYSQYWNSFSYLTLSLSFDDNFTYPIVSTAPHNIQEYQFSVNIHFILPYNSKDNMCNHPLSSIPTDWFTYNYKIDDTWIPCTSQRIQSVQTLYELFRSHFVYTKLPIYHGFELILHATSAHVIYINGELLETNNLPEGPLTNTSVPIEPSIEFMYYRHSFSLDYLQEGDNVIAIAQVFSVSSNSTITCSVRLLTETIFYNRYFDGHIIAPADNYTTINYILSPFSSYNWEYHFHTSSTLPISLVVYPRISSSLEYINSYCFISSIQPSYMNPSSWSLYACTSVSCDLIHVINHYTWEFQEITYCFHTFAHLKSYSIYKFIFESVTAESLSSIIAIKKIILFSQNPPLANKNLTFTYTQSHVHGYLYIELNSNSPSCNSYLHNFSILYTSLPNGLILDSSSGQISGTPTELMPLQIVTIQAFDENEFKYTAQFYMEVKTCSYPSALITIQLERKILCKTCSISFTLYDVTQNTILDSVDNIQSSHRVQYYYCFPTLNYKLSIYSIGYNSLSTVKYSIYLRNIYILKAAFINQFDDAHDIYFNINDFMYPDTFIWSYTNNGDTVFVPSSDWMSLDYNDVDWLKSNYLSLQPPIGITQYYRYTFVVSNSQIYSGISFNIFTYTGCIIYLNGIEIFRFNLPKTLVISTTCALSLFTRIQMPGSSISLTSGIVSLFEGKNVFAVEMHRTYQPQKTSVFYFDYVLLHSYHNYLSYHYVVQSIPDSLLPNTLHSLFDDDINTTYISYGMCVGTEILFETSLERTDSFTRYSLQNGNFCNNWCPSGWIIQGSKDGITYSTIHETHKQYFTKAFQIKNYTIAVSHTYRTFKLIVTECDNKLLTYSSVSDPSVCQNKAMQLSSFFLNFERVNYSCKETEDGYRAALSNSYAYKDCPVDNEGYMSMMCVDGQLDPNTFVNNCKLIPPLWLEYRAYTYTFYVDIPLYPLYPSTNLHHSSFLITPKLPMGLFMDSNTGIISGIPLYPLVHQRYTITMSNSKDILTKVIEIEVKGSRSLLYCFSDDTSSVIPLNTTIQTNCSEGFTGIAVKQCVLNQYPVWIYLNNTCTVIPDYIFLSYSFDTYILYIHQLVVISPFVSGQVNHWSVTPALTNNITFSEGVFTGVPITLSDSITYTITAYGINNATVSITFQFEELYCESDSKWPKTPAGEYASLPCESDYYTGDIQRHCLYGNGTAFWSDVMNLCYMIPPIVEYPSLSFVFVINTMINGIIPSVEGICTNFEISPSLPSGLFFNEFYGYITGTPSTSQELTTHTITVSNRDASVSYFMNITVLYYGCPQDEEWPETAKGVLVFKPCSNPYMEGNIYRQCTNTVPCSWDGVMNYCKYKIPIIKYKKTSYTLFVSVTIEPIIPIVENVITSWDISSPLPKGLFFNTTSGIITGTPLSYQSSISYLIGAYNSDSSTSVTLTISVEYLYCAGDSVWKTISVNSIDYAYCEKSTTRYRTRECLQINTNALWNSESNETCYKSASYDSTYSKFSVTLSITPASVEGTAVTPFDLFVIYKALILFFSPYNLQQQDISIDSVTVNITVAFSFNVALHVSVLKTGSESLVTVFKNDFYTSFVPLCNVTSSLFASSSLTYFADSIMLTNYPSYFDYTFIITLIFIGVICLILLVLLTLHCKERYKRKRHPNLISSNEELYSHSYIEMHDW